jgi:putative oxidoreductase
MNSNPIVPLAGRILLAAIFLVAGYGKLMAFAGTSGYFAKLGFPAPDVMTVLAIAVELGGALLLIAGWHARWAAWALILFVAVATFAAHRFWEFDASQYRNQMNHFLKNLALIGGLLFVVAFGPGAMSANKK